MEIPVNRYELHIPYWPFWSQLSISLSPAATESFSNPAQEYLRLCSILTRS